MEQAAGDCSRMEMEEMSKLKVFTGNLDGKREALVIATSKKLAAKKIGCGLKSFNDYFQESDTRTADEFDPDGPDSVLA